MKVGSLVLCIDDINQSATEYLNGKLVKGEIYTVTGFDKSWPAVFLEEKPIKRNGYEISHWARRFREVQPPMDLSELMEEPVYKEVKQESYEMGASCRYEL